MLITYRYNSNYLQQGLKQEISLGYIPQSHSSVKSKAVLGDFGPLSCAAFIAVEWHHLYYREVAKHYNL
jgi:hypothetical protein